MPAAAWSASAAFVSGLRVMLNPGVLERTDHGEILFPYDDVYVDFMLHAV